MKGTAFLLISALCTVLIPCRLAAQDSGGAVPSGIRRAFARAGVPALREKAGSIDFTAPLLDGKQARLSDYKGKVVFLNFWATWCPPCRSEMPSMERLYQRFRGRGLEFLAVDIQETKQEVAGFMKEFNLTFPAALDSGGISAQYGIRSIPATFIIDREGKVLFMTVGGREWDTEAMYAAFEQLLNFRGTE
jgi:thiol-disulfide isomerase/thioredoxin